MADLETEYIERVMDVDPPATTDEAAANLAAAIENADVVVQAFGANGQPASTALSITGSDPEDQLDSIVAVLVAFGLATDDR